RTRILAVPRKLRQAHIKLVIPSHVLVLIDVAQQIGDGSFAQNRRHRFDFFWHLRDQSVQQLLFPVFLCELRDRVEREVALNVDATDLLVPQFFRQPEADLIALAPRQRVIARKRSEEHTSELQSRSDLVCRLLLEKKKNACEYDS